MRATQLPLFTQKEDPKDAQVVSHKLLTRAGYIKKQASGFYVFLPFGWMVHRKIEEIVRKNMNKYGAVEVHLPILTPAELWEESGRWNAMGAEMMRLKDRHAAGFALGPTHEESITWLAKQYLQSYKQLPVNYYQIGVKYRDEIRPRYGLIRCREFVMKDAYSFHIDEKSLDETYQKMRECYRDIFNECSLETLSVEADSGAMGGSGSEEFMVASAIGEETLLLCSDDKNCGYRSNQEKTPFVPAENYPVEKNEKTPKRKDTPNVKTVDEVADFFKVDKKQFIKTVIYENSESIILVFIPGDREISEVKLKNILGVAELEMASPEAIEKVTSAAVGFAGPFDLPVKENEEIIINKNKKKIIFLYDEKLKGRGNLISGGNKTDMHYINLQEGRDFIISKEFIDLVTAQDLDLCPKCKKNKLKGTRGIEVGHVFKLGKKYTEALNVTVLDKLGKELIPTMGCYGIGVGRTLSTIVEQSYDDKGIIWPESVTPFKYYLIGIFNNDTDKKEIEALYEKMIANNMSVYFDDRDERPGIKFNDADLTGFTLQIVAGKNYIKNKVIEIKNRKSGEKTEISESDFLSKEKS
ncbi:MAG: proline--tRNA ligase [Spirochaetia bacterium]|nr:proline--tRNA ligase [Spirochaetia bacterium]